MEVVAKTQKEDNKKWSELPEELVALIGESISLYADYVRFLCVCVSWRNSVLAKKTHLNHLHPSSQQQRQRQYFPFLLLPCCDQEEGKSSSCSLGLLSIAENNKIYYPQGLLQSKEFMSMHCLESSHGWLVIVDEKGTPPTTETFKMYLINPFTRAQLPLPPISTLLLDDVDEEEEEEEEEEDQQYPSRVNYSNNILNSLNRSSVKKVVLSSSPSSSSASQFQSQSSNVMAIAIIDISPGRIIAFSRPGDKAWTPFASDSFMHILFYRDHLYALRSRWNNNEKVNVHDILIFHMDTSGTGGGHGCCPTTLLHPKLVDTLKSPKRKGYHSKLGRRSQLYLVESCGDLLMVEREEELFFRCPKPGLTKFDIDDVKTIGFRVYKLCRFNNLSADAYRSAFEDRKSFEQIDLSQDVDAGDGCLTGLEVQSSDYDDIGTEDPEAVTEEHCDGCPCDDCAFGAY
ncbi:uncharacterized protein LOC122651232 [Telopea speciosissima]|uniref:uncharacterized protein LOC122651232 n=1 Tax=Telopea speciosissima TaxID=54955 RepID=UPI001CC3C13A|nr:uncharacterized protein LOC122651232 [Telopea speciosissima]